MTVYRGGWFFFLLPSICWLIYATSPFHELGPFFNNEHLHSESLTYLTADELVNLADSVVGEDEYVAEQLALEGLAKNVTSGRASAYLLELYMQQKRQKSADSMAATTKKLWPAHSYAQARLSRYWLETGDIRQFLRTADIMMFRDYAAMAKLFPALKILIAKQEFFPLFSAYMGQPTAPWWKDFFAYLTIYSDLGLLDKVMMERNIQKGEITKYEYNLYVKSLAAAGRWSDAHNTWLRSVSADDSVGKNMFFDGEFSLGVDDGGVFGWQMLYDSGFKGGVEPERGVSDNKFLHLSFIKRKRVGFKQVSQRLVLLPGAYQFSGKYKTQRFKGKSELVWTVRCSNSSDAVLGRGSISVENSDQWSAIKFVFNVPSVQCETQKLELGAGSPYAYNHFFEGHVWFDKFKLSRLDEK